MDAAHSSHAPVAARFVSADSFPTTNALQKTASPIHPSPIHKYIPCLTQVAILTCMDARLHPNLFLGLGCGE